MDDKRLTDIETKIAYQERMISELNIIVYDQQKTIEDLKKMVEFLRNRVMDLADMSSLTDPGNEKPPHY